MAMRVVRSRPVRISAWLMGLMVAGLSVIAFTAAGACADISITVMTPEAENPQATEWYQKVLKPAFEKATGIKVDIQLADWGTYLEKLPVLFASGKAPDVFTVGGEFLGSYVRAGMVQPLNQWTDRWEGLADYPPPALLDGTIDGKLYTIPYRLDQRTLLYRKDFFEVAGLDSRHPPATWDELVEFGRKLVIRDEKGEFKRDAINIWPHWSVVGIFILQNGGRFVTPDGLKAAYDSPAAIEAMRFVVDLSQRYKIAGPWGSPWQGADSVVTGTSAMSYSGAWVLGEMQRVNPANVAALGVALPPKRVNRSGMLFVNKWAIARTSKHPEAAWKFIEFITEPERMAEISRINSHLPARMSVIKGFSPWKDDPRWLIFLASANETVPFPANANKLADVLAGIENAMRATLEGKQTLEQAVTGEAQKATQLLKTT